MLMPSRSTRQQEWLLKNSLTSISQKLLRIRKLYKRFFPVSWTFSITRFSTFFKKTDFFNSHKISRHLFRFKDPWPSDFITLLLLTVPIGSGRSNFCWQGRLTPEQHQTPIQEDGNGSVTVETEGRKL